MAILDTQSPEPSSDNDSASLPGCTPAPAQQSGYASAKALAREFETTESTIWRWAASGRIPAPLKLGPGTTRWEVAEVRKALGLTAEG